MNMKPLILASALVALAFTPAHGAALKSPRDLPLIVEFLKMNIGCYRIPFPDDDEDEYGTNGPTRKKVCAAEARLYKRLQAKGYCAYGHIAVGVAHGKHCYTIKDEQLDKAIEKPLWKD
jgi:hypothetical protein